MSDTHTIDFTHIKSYIHYNAEEALVATYGCPIRLREYPQLLAMARKLGLVVSADDTLPGRSLVYRTPTGLEVNVYAKRPMCYRRYLRRFNKLVALFPNPVDLSKMF